MGERTTKPPVTDRTTKPPVNPPKGGDTGAGPDTGAGDQGAGADQGGDQSNAGGDTNQKPKAAPARPKVPADSNGRKDEEATDLLLEACDVFGVNPDPDVRPVELLSWRYYAEDRRTDTCARVVLVTAGGQKLGIWDDPDVPLESDTEERLRNIFGAWGVDPVTKQKVPTPLPADLTLPRLAVTGIPDQGGAHRHPGGYLRRKRK